MSWTEELYAIYELNSSREYEGNEAKMLPVAHSTANAQIEITIDTNGNFKSANKVVKKADKKDDKKDDKKAEKSEAVTVIPATEDSANRTSGISAMPFADKLIYIAGDYSDYAEGKKSDNSDYFTAYINGLKEWCESEYSHDSVKALYNYISKKTVMKNLTEDAHVLETDELTGKLKDKVKIEGIAQEDSFVRFIVDYPAYDFDKTRKTWEDKSLQEKFISYYSTKMGDKQLCYASGEIVPVTYKHPSKVRNAGDKAKLLSANDESGFTYRGRFTDKEQAVSVGYEYSQKVHNALRWLIERQSFTLDSLTIVTWSSGLKAVPDFKERLISDEDLDDEDFEAPDTAQGFSEILRKRIFGYKQKMAKTDKIIIMGLDAATTGRMNISMYSEFENSRYFENIEYWHATTEWLRFDGKHKKNVINSFSLPEIIKCAFGTEKGKFIDCDKKIMKEYLLKLIPCVIDRLPIMQDMLNMLYFKASNPLAYSEQYNHRNVLEAACGMIRKDIIYRNKINKEDYLMAYDPNEKNRSYLYGCLLAIADKAESDSYEKDESGRITNARRYWNTFSARPYQTWKIIEERLRPYMDKLNPGTRIYYEKKINEITDKMTVAEFTKNTKLEPLYLLGYHHYTAYLYSKKNEEEKS